MPLSYEPRRPAATDVPGDGLPGPERVTFIVVSFEGPDRYSQAGGLGVRVSGLVETLADLGFETHLFFIGDPDMPGEEQTRDGRLVLHRWAQWISANCRAGVYDGEAGKVADVTSALPPYLMETLLEPALGSGRIPVLIFEEWQTAECACRVSDLLGARGVRDRAVITWNANNPYGFERIDWLRLAAATTITTISRHMRSIIRSCGADAVVVPNGIPQSALDRAPTATVNRIRGATSSNPGIGLLFKMARWEREKGWCQALDAVQTGRAGNDDPSRAESRRPVLVARSGGPTGTGAGLAREAGARGLRVVAFDTEGDFLAGMSEALQADTDVLSLRFGVSPSLARALYTAVDGVLANSVAEPFGLVGLEAMAAGGVAFTGGTGEDYAVGGRNAIVLESLDPAEIIARWNDLMTWPRLGARLRRAARKTAREYTWPEVVAQLLLPALARQASRQGIGPLAARTRPTTERAVTPISPQATGVPGPERRMSSGLDGDSSMATRQAPGDDFGDPQAHGTCDTSVMT